MWRLIRECIAERFLYGCNELMEISRCIKILMEFLETQGVREKF